MSFEFPIRVYIEDTDLGGIVYYVNYFKFMERARTEFLRQYAIQQQQLKDQDYLFVVKSAQCDYKAPALLDDALTVTVEVLKHSAASVTFSQQIIAGCVLCSAHIEVVCVSATSMKPRRFPPQIKQIFSRA